MVASQLAPRRLWGGGVMGLGPEGLLASFLYSHVSLLAPASQLVSGD